MSVFLHDGTAEGFLTALSRALDMEEPPETISPENSWTPSLFDEGTTIRTDSEISKSLIRKIEERISHRAVRHVFYCFNSEFTDLGIPLCGYLKKGFEFGSKVDGFHADKSVDRILYISGQVGMESHRLKGLLRFRKLPDGIFFAQLEPVYNVILPVALHFTKRLSSEKWIIQDVRRRIAVTWDGKELGQYGPEELDRLTAGTVSGPAEGKDEYQELWKIFFKNIAIPERRNIGLQAQNMPRRYWKYLVEI